MSMPKKKPRALPKEFHKTTFSSTAGKIRYLNRVHGWKAGDIARTLGISPQHAYNVINRKLKGDW